MIFAEQCDKVAARTDSEPRRNMQRSNEDGNVKIRLSRWMSMLLVTAVMLATAAGGFAADQPWVHMKLYDGGELQGQWFGYVGFNEVQMSVGVGHWMRLSIQDAGTDNCPGGGNCTGGASNRWEVQVSHGAGIGMGWELFLGIGTPGVICESETDRAYTLVQDCPSTLYLASGSALGVHDFAVEFLPDSTASTGACCGNWPGPGCVEVTEDQCTDLGGTWQGGATTCASAGCGPTIDNVPALNVLGLALLTTLMIGGGLVYMRSRRREDV